MGLLDSTQESTDQALAVMASQPLDPVKPEPKHSAWTVIPRAMAAGAAEVGGNVMDTLGAAGQVAAASGGITPGFDPNEQEKESQRAAAKLKDEGIDWRGSEGQDAYNVAHDLRPDPITAGKAEQVIFGLGKGLTKAIGASLVAGPVAGAAAFGVSEGMTTAEDLAREGVDPATRTKVGVVTGALNTAGMMIPVAGKTMAQTIALGFAGGPASFMAQQQATRSILESANYGEIAAQYDPLDPVGLTIASLLPAGFGAWAMRGARGARKAEAEADVVAPKPGEVAPIAQETVAASPPEHVDAAMVHNLTLARDVHEANGGAQFESMMRVSLDEADRLIANQAQRFSGSDFFTARDSAVAEMNMADSEYSFSRPADGRLLTQSELGARIINSMNREEALQRIASGKQLVQLPGSPDPVGVQKPESSVPEQKYTQPVAKPTSVTKESFTDLAATQTRYQGNKREFFKNNGSILAKEVAPYTHDVGTMFDMYAGGGTYGLSMVASGAFPNIKRVVINEVDGLRNARLRGAIEKGGRIMDPWNTDPVMIQLAEKLKPLIGKSSSPAAMAMEGKGKYSDYGDWIAKNLVTDTQKTARLALHDVMFSGRTATWDRLIKNATEDADRIHALANQAKSRGAAIEVVSLDATGPEAISLVRGAGRSFVLLDPPYHKTSAGTYAAKEATDFGGDVFLHKNMIAAKEMSIGNSVVYNNAETPGVKAVAKDVFRGNMKQYGWKRQNGQREFLGVYHDTATSSGSSWGVRGEGASPATGGILAVDGTYSSRQADSRTTISDQSSGNDRIARQQQEVKTSDTATGPSHKDQHIASILDRAEAIKTETPDMPVAVREDGTHATAAEEIAAIRKQAKEGTETTLGVDDAPLLEVAANCFLSLGG